VFPKQQAAIAPPALSEAVAAEKRRRNFYISPDIQLLPVRAMQEVRTFRCKDLGLACEFEEKAESENELMKRVEGHVQTAHQMNPEQPEVQEKLRKAVK
jgi:predicted small metal-binding protein